MPPLASALVAGIGLGIMGTLAIVFMLVSAMDGRYVLRREHVAVLDGIRRELSDLNEKSKD